MAQSTTTTPQQPERPRPGTILDRPGTGRITDAPAAPTTPAPQAARPQPSGAEPLAGQPVERFEAVGNATVASDTIRVYLGVTPGEAYDPAALQRNFQNLWQTGLFDDIRLEADRGDTGVIVRAVVKERPRIGSVEYRGNKELATAKITEALERARIDLHVGSAIEQTLIKRASEAIRTAYSEGGFEGVSVETMLEDLPQPGERKVVFIINEGIKARVADIEFEGNKRFSDRRLRTVMKEVKEHGIISWVRKKNLYIPSKLDEDLEHVKNYYQDHGYQAVSFGDPQVITVGRNTKKPRVKLVIPVKEGPVHTFGNVTVNGNTVFTNEQIIGEWPLKQGETLRRKPIQTRIEAFGEAYRMRGYIYAYVNPEYTIRDGNVVDVDVQVFEGDQFRLGRLEFQGNTVTKDKVLRREIFLEEGQIMDMETFKQSLYKLGQLGFFKVTENPDFKVNQESKTVDILVKGNEEGKNDIQFGGGYSEGGGMFLQAQFATRNFLGEGENFGLSYQRGNRINFFSLSYSDPWFLDTPNSLGVSLFNTQTTYPASFGVQERGRGGTIAYGYRVGRFDSLSLMYGVQRTRTHYEFQTPPDPQGNVPVAAIADYSFTMSSIIPSYRYDSRDNPFDPMRGSRLSFGVSYAGGPLGGSINMIKPVLNVTRLQRLTRRSTFAVNAEFGYIVPTNEDNCSHSYNEQLETGQSLCVPLGERFLVGGEQSVRGFDFGYLGPREARVEGGFLNPVGGYKSQVYNLEYIYRVNDPLRFVLFADAGFAYARNEDVDFGKLRYSTGAELRIFLPVFQFPLRFIYAINPSPKDGDDDIFEAFQFTIGNTF